MILDSGRQDIRFTWRSFRAAPFASLTIVTTVGVGLGLVAVVFTILNAIVFRVDEVRKPDELFAIDRQRSADTAPQTFTRLQYEQLLRETVVFSDAFATTPEMDFWIEGRRLEGPLTTGGFFQVLGVSAAHGRTFSPSDDEPGRPPVLVLSHRAWSRHFAGDPGVINRTVRMNGASVHVVGVMPEGFRGLTVIAPDFWAPLSVLDQLSPGTQARDDAVALQIVGRLKPYLSRGHALAQLVRWDSQAALARSGSPPAASLVLEPRLGTFPQPAQAMLLFVPLFFAFGLVLMIGCANVANLLLARGVARQREIGIRLAMGASRGRVVSQLLTENLLLALVSAAIGFGVSRLALAGAAYLVTSTLPPEIGNLRVVVPPADWRVALFLVAGAMASTLMFALAPALQATRVALVRAVRGEVVRDGRPGRARDALLAVQVTGSVLLLICAAVFLRSSWAAAAADPGIRTASVVTAQILDEQRRRTILNLMTSEASVASIAASWPHGLGGRPALAEGTSGKSRVTYQFVSPEYFGVLGIDVVLGRGFVQSERIVDVAVAVVSAEVAGRLWPGMNAVGQTLRLEADTTNDPREPGDPPAVSQGFVVVGVAKDVAGFRLGGVRMAGAGVYLPISSEAANTLLTMRVRGDAEAARRALVDRLAAIDPNMGNVETLAAVARAEAYLLAIPFWLTLGLGGLALLLTLSGLFGVLSYLVEQRTREIGVRMTLGATRRGIAGLVLSQSVRPVGAGLILGVSGTAALGAALLATPAAEQIGSSVRLFDPVAYAAGLIWIATACTCAALIPALRAARIEPACAIRQD